LVAEHDGDGSLNLTAILNIVAVLIY